LQTAQKSCGAFAAGLESDCSTVSEAQKRSITTGFFEGYFPFLDPWAHKMVDGILSEALATLPGGLAFDLLAEQPGLALGLLDLPFTDTAAVQVEAPIATAGTEGFTVIGNRLWEPHAAMRIAAHLAELLIKLGHGNSFTCEFLVMKSLAENTNPTGFGITDSGLFSIECFRIEALSCRIWAGVC
jgi:hypothetical protein